MSDPVKGERRFRVWAGNMSGTVWAGWMRYDGRFWVSQGKRYDVTDDVLALNGLAPQLLDQQQPSPSPKEDQ